MVEERYFRLDNGAVFMAAIAQSSGPMVYRLAVDFTQTIEIGPLERALALIAPRFPTFFVSLRHGVFWHYLEPVDRPPRIEAESSAPCAAIPYRRHRPLIRISAYGRRLAVDYHHVVTDGTGGLSFLRSLTREYLVQRGLVSGLAVPLPAGLLRRDSPAEEGEEEDSYARYFRESAPLPERVPQSFLIPGLRRFWGYRTTVGVLPLDAVLAFSKSKGVSLTEFLTSVHIAALQELYEERRAVVKGLRPRICVQVPVNLRKIYPSRTLRNFFLFADPSIDLRLGHWAFDEILAHVHHQLRLGLEPKELQRQLKRNVGGERNPLARPIFLPIKTVVMRIINTVIGVGSYSGSLSNLGSIEMDEASVPHIDRFSMVPSRAVSTGANVGVLSWQGSLYISIGSLVVEREFERLFFSRLASLGLCVRVEMNEV